MNSQMWEKLIVCGSTISILDEQCYSYTYSTNFFCLHADEARVGLTKILITNKNLIGLTGTTSACKQKKCKEGTYG